MSDHTPTPEELLEMQEAAGVEIERMRRQVDLAVLALEFHVAGLESPTDQQGVGAAVNIVKRNSASVFGLIAEVVEILKEPSDRIQQEQGK